MLETIFSVMSLHPIFTNILILIASFFIVAKSSDLTVLSISEYARHFGISDYLIGFLVLAIGSSLPEFAASLTGSSAHESGVIFGTLIGSGITTLTLVLGLIAIFAKRIILKDKILNETRLALFPMIVLPFVLMIDGTLSRIDGFILLFIFLSFVVYLWQKEGSFGKLKSAHLKHVWRHALVFLGSLIAILLSARWLVFSSINLASLFHISPFFIAIFVISLGSSLPDLMVQLRSLRKGRTSIGIGEILGALIVEMNLMLGILALIHEIPLGSLNFFNIGLTGAFYIGTLSYILYLMGKKEMTQKNGIVLVSIYFLFIVTQIIVAKMI